MHSGQELFSPGTDKGEKEHVEVLRWRSFPVKEMFLKESPVSKFQHLEHLQDGGLYAW